MYPGTLCTVLMYGIRSRCTVAVAVRLTGDGPNASSAESFCCSLQASKGTRAEAQLWSQGQV